VLGVGEFPVLKVYGESPSFHHCKRKHKVP
jgi:hypothetical protein